MAGDDIEDVKRSVTIAGHRTSISLERPFWDALKEVACSEKTSVNELVRRIDVARGGKGSLSSAIRVHVLKAIQAKASSCRTDI
ncbi:MAG: ribbon-helix-helix domain-containing protein [Parvibaculum sp.]|jgi:predicted DNA-binding ribbon-helix-helix protein|nr:ribbon-helix-helix domain-containing protein [Parvibaculum sp.]